MGGCTRGCSMRAGGCTGGCERPSGTYLGPDLGTIRACVSVFLPLTMPLPPTEWWATTDTVYAGCPMRLHYEYSSPSCSSPVPLEVSCGEPAANAVCHVVTPESLYAAVDMVVLQQGHEGAQLWVVAVVPCHHTRTLCEDLTAPIALVHASSGERSAADAGTSSWTNLPTARRLCRQ
jgi:hypothetical protein